MRNIAKREKEVCSKLNNKAYLACLIKDVDEDTLDKVVKGQK